MMKRKFTILGSGVLMITFLVWFLMVSGPAGVALDLPILMGNKVSVYFVYLITGLAELLLIAPLAVYMIITKTNIRALMGNRTSLKQNLLALALGVLLVPGLYGMDALFAELFKLLGAKPLDTGMIEPNTVGQLLAGMLAIGATAGVVEEPIFRGVVLRGLGSAASKKTAIILTALAFSLVHMDIVGATERFVIGLLLGYMAWRAGAILPGVLTHAAFNSTALGMSLLLTKTLPDWNGFQLVPAFSQDINGMLTTVLLSLPFAAGAYFVYRLFTQATPATAAWSPQPYAVKEVKGTHYLAWIGSGVFILIVTVLLSLMMWMDLPGMQDVSKFFK
jgi:membrane protease YdiL (CAAX protease family)